MTDVWGKIVEAYVKEAPQVEEVAKGIYRKHTPPTTEKKCARCGVVKPRSEFYPRPSHSPNAITQKCKQCHSEINNKRNKRRKENEV